MTVSKSSDEKFGYSTPPTGQGATTPQTAFEKIMEGFLPAITGATPKTIEQLENMTDQVVTGPLTEQEIGQLQGDAQLLIDQPTLSPSDKALVSLFQIRLTTLLLKMKTGGSSVPPGGILPVAHGNAFLNTSAMVELYQNLMAIAMLETKMLREESKLRQSMALIQITVAKEIANLMIQLGDVAAEKCIAAATEDFIEGAMSICQIVVSVATIAMTQSKTQKAEEEYQQKKEADLVENDADLPPGKQKYLHEPDAKAAIGGKSVTTLQTEIDKRNADRDALLKKDSQLTPDEKSRIGQQASQDVANQMTIWTHGITAFQGIARGAVELTKAEFERETGQLEAAKQMLQQLLDMMGKSISQLTGDEDATKKSMEKLLDMVKQFAEISTRMGPGAA